jgi:hypothetical protein
VTIAWTPDPPVSPAPAPQPPPPQEPPATPASGATGAGAAPSPGSSSASVTKLKASLRRQIVPTGKDARISKLPRPGGIGLRVTAPAGGSRRRLWYAAATAKRGAKQLLVARGALTFARARTTTIRIRATAAGRRLLKHAKRVRMTARGVFTPERASTVVATRAFVLKR